jgi:hypothetical protein
MCSRGKHLNHLNFIPGRLVLKPGTRADYKSLERFHYIAGPPATWAQIWTIYHQSCIHTSSDLRKSAQICAICGHSGPATRTPIAIVSYPCLNSHARDRALNLSRLTPNRRQRFINQHIRTISRLIVHPTYRGLSLASILINCILKNCTTRYTEALATMAKAHPLFSRSAMKEFPPDHEDKPHYYLFDNRKSKIENRKSISPPCESSCKATGHK